MSRPRLISRRTAVPKRQLHTRPPLDRMQQIFHSIKSGEFPNRHRLAADIEVTTKTIQRDIDFMRERLRLPIAYDPDGGGYEQSTSSRQLPNPRSIRARIEAFVGYTLTGLDFIEDRIYWLAILAVRASYS